MTHFDKTQYPKNKVSLIKRLRAFLTKIFSLVFNSTQALGLNQKTKTSNNPLADYKVEELKLEDLEPKECERLALDLEKMNTTSQQEDIPVEIVFLNEETGEITTLLLPLSELGLNTTEIKAQEKTPTTVSMEASQDNETMIIEIELFPADESFDVLEDSKKKKKVTHLPPSERLH